MKLGLWVFVSGAALLGCSGRSVTDGALLTMSGGSDGAGASSGDTVIAGGAFGFGGSGGSPGLVVGTGGLSACGDTESDPLNCGVCGNSCPAGPCKGGTCRSSSGGTALVTGEMALELAVDSSNVYWISYASSSYAVKRCAISGCPGGPTILWQSLSPTRWLAVAGGSVWWVDIGATNTYVFQCSTLGCGAAPNVFAESQAEQTIRAFAANDAGLAWASSSGDVFSCPLSGCPSVGPTKLFTVMGEPAGYVVEDSTLFGFDLGADGVEGFGQINHLFSCPLSGCTSGPTILGTVDTSGALAVDATNAYWIYKGTSNTGFGGILPVPPTSWHDGAVYTCPLTGCVGAPTALAQYATWYMAIAIAADASGEYWTVGHADGTIDGDSAQLVRCNGAGCGSGPTTLATLATGSTPAIALDQKNIYWIDSALGSSMMRPKEPAL